MSKSPDNPGLFLSDFFSLILIVLKGNSPSDIRTHGGAGRSFITAMLLTPAFSLLCLFLSHVAIVLVLRSHFALLFLFINGSVFRFFSKKKNQK
jgi:hypothetical protein